MNRVAGIDGYKNGWFCVWLDESEKFKSKAISGFEGVFQFFGGFEVVGIDIPIGLLEHAIPGGRECDRQARVLLGKRGCCVFSPPVRASLRERDYRKACDINSTSSPHSIKMSRQTFSLISKLREVHKFLEREGRSVFREVHPELSFYAMNNYQPIEEKKKSTLGIMRRKALLEDSLGKAIDLESFRKVVEGLEKNDILDAFAALWTALRIIEKKGSRLPKVSSDSDSKGLAMEIWY